MAHDTDSHEMGNMATVKTAHEDPVMMEPEPNSEVASKSDYGDKDNLARLGKKQVLKVRQRTAIHLIDVADAIPSATSASRRFLASAALSLLLGRPLPCSSRRASTMAVPRV